MAREPGYTVVIKGFIPVPKNDLDRQVTAAQGLIAAQKEKTIVGISGVMIVDEIRQSFGTRDRPDAPAANGEGKPEGAGGEQGELAGTGSRLSEGDGEDLGDRVTVRDEDGNLVEDDEGEDEGVALGLAPDDMGEENPAEAQPHPAQPAQAPQAQKRARR